MNAQEALDYALAKPGAWQDEPWDGDLVAKVEEKIFVFCGDRSIGLKCGDHREEADEWLLRYPDDASVMAYIGRFGWNTLVLDGNIPDHELQDAIDDSYLRVVSRLRKSRRPQGWEEA